jgi:hypothetical protein
MIESRLNKLAAEMARRAAAPRVLDYASPDTPRSGLIPEWLSDELEYRGGACCVALKMIGRAMVVWGIFVRPGLFGLLMVVVGLILELLAWSCRTWRDLKL